MESRDLPLYPSFEDHSIGEYLAVLWPDCSGRTIDELFANGRLRCAGRPVARNRFVGDLPELVLVGSELDLTRIPTPDTAFPGPLGVIHEDDHLIVLDKPSGLSVIPDRKRGAESCLGYLIRRELDERKTKPPEDFLRYRIVHRIDRLTSGLVLVAKTAETERQLHRDFEEHRIEKIYTALVVGDPAAPVATVNCPIVPGRKGKMRARLVDGAPRAETTFIVRERYGRCALVEARPRTGRTHQIRVHAWAWGHPLIVDPLYGPREARSPAGIDRLTLHATRYTLPEYWEEPRSFHSSLAVDLERALSELRESH